jgi:hypothetical protein
MSDFENESMKTGEEMDEFELALKRAMQRVDAPESLVKFLTAATEVKQERVLPWRERKHPWAFFVPKAQAWMGGALAAVLALGMYGAEVLHQRREQAKADQQFAVAMQATGHALAQTREQLQRAGLKLGE